MDRAKALEGMLGADSTRRLYTALSMILERRRWWRGMSMFVAFFQCCLSAAEARRWTEVARYGKVPGSLPNMADTKGACCERELKYAARACSTALRRPKPPWLQGREALIQDHCFKGLPTIVDKVSRIVSSKLVRASLMRLGGQVRREKEILGSAKQFRKRVWQSENLLNLATWRGYLLTW